MQMLSQLLSLPPPLLVLFATCSVQHAAAQSWPYNLPAHQKYWPEHEHLVKRDAEIHKRLATEVPIGVRKMSDDPNEMFFMDYWRFAGDPDDPTSLGKERRGIDSIEDRKNDQTKSWLRDRQTMSSNTSLPMDYLAPFLLHSEETQSPLDTSPRLFARSPLLEKHFQCPSGTGRCTGINRPNSCCAFDEECVLIPRTNELGDVGCCPKGQTCAGGAIGCDTSQGYSACPGSSNGGCCIPNYICDGVGCIYDRSQSVTTSVKAGTTTKTIYDTTSASAKPQGTLTVTNFASTVTLPIIGPTTCMSGYQSCPASLDGGCCRTDRVCASGGYCGVISTTTVESTVTITPKAPVRPTLESYASVDALTTTTVFPSVCPTGYYQCSAYYPGGCCQVGRDCSSTNCPRTASTTVVTSSVTVVVPTGQGTTFVIVQGGTTTGEVVISPSGSLGQGQCANGWYRCSSSGDCCPQNYVCGSDSTCTNNGNANGPGTVKEIAVGQSPQLRSMGVWMVALALAFGFGTFYL